MVEFARQGPLAAVTGPRGAAVTVLRPCTRFLLQGRPPAIARADEALGLTLPRTACRSATSRDLAALWLGPEEWLLLADEDGFSAQLAAALADLPHSLVDISHRQAALQVEGPDAADLINSGCPLDLDSTTFPVGACTRTVLAKIEIVLWRTGDARFRLEVSRSLADYAWLLLHEAKED